MVQGQQLLRLFLPDNMRIFSRKGLTFIETVLYIGLIAIILPTMFLSLVYTTRIISLLDVRHEIALSSTTILSLFTKEVSEAQHIRTSLSTFGSNPSTFVYVDSLGVLVTIDRPTVSVTLPGGNQTVRRLRMQRGASASFYLTDPDVDVVSFQADPVRNSSGVLTGLRIHLDLDHTAQSVPDPLQKAQFVSDVTLDLQPHTTET